VAALTGIKKNDQVKVLAGKNRGAVGRVLIVQPREGKVVVEGVQLMKRHTKPNPQRNIKGGIVEKEAAIDLSNVALLCKNCNKAVRFGHKGKDRICRKCGNTI